MKTVDVFLLLAGLILIWSGTSNLTILIPSVPSLTTLSPSHQIYVPSSVSPLSVPFYNQDPTYLYLNPDGLCRFAVEEMIISYWYNRGYVSGPVPSQYTLYVEEKHGAFNETMYYEAFTNRGLFVVDQKAFKLPFASYENNILTKLDGDAQDAVYFAKVYLSNGIPLFGAVAINSDGWPDPNGYPLPNHAITYTGYNETGFFFDNAVSLNLSKPANGPNKFMPFTTFVQGESDHLWWFTAVFPRNYPQILSQIRVRVTGTSSNTVYSPWGSDIMDPSGYVTIMALKTGSFVTIGSKFPVDNTEVYGTDGYGIYFVYPDTTTIAYGGTDPLTKPLTPHSWEPIPNPPPVQPGEPIYQQPIPGGSQPTVQQTSTFRPELLIGIALIGVVLIRNRGEK